MANQRVMGFAGVFAVVGVSAAVWSLTRHAGGPEREFGRIGMPAAEDRGPGDGPGRRAADAGAGASRQMSLGSGGDGPPRPMVAEEAIDPGSLSFPEVRDESEAQRLLDELRGMLAARASGATAYRQAPPLGKQRFADAAVSFLSPYFLTTARPIQDEASEDGIPAEAYFGRAVALASMDLSRVRVGDAPERLSFTLPDEVLAGLPERRRERDGDDEGGGFEMSISMMSGDDGWTTRTVTHPMSAGSGEKPDGVPVAEVAVPIMSPGLERLVTQAHLRVTLWWNEAEQAWAPGDTVLRYRVNDAEKDASASLREVFK